MANLNKERDSRRVSSSRQSPAAVSQTGAGFQLSTAQHLVHTAEGCSAPAATPLCGLRQWGLLFKMALEQRSHPCKSVGEEMGRGQQPRRAQQQLEDTATPQAPVDWLVPGA